MTRVGTVYLIGGGPGDPELVTQKAVRCLGRADLVLYDALVHPDLLKYCQPHAERVFVGKRAGRTHERQASINERLIEAARAGRTVARLKGGDPYLFGRGSEEAEALAAAGIAFEVVPGVPSPSAATAYAGMSLTHRDLSSSVAYVTATESPEKDRSAHDWQKLATATQTLVIFMGMRKLDSLMRVLVEHGRPASCPAAVIQWASTPQQRTVVGTVGDIAAKAAAAGLGMPALTVVGEIVRLREKLRWYDQKPLFGRRVLVTRAREQSESLAQALREAGAAAIELPMISIQPPQDREPLSRAIARLRDYSYLVFTSQNGVSMFFAELAAQSGDSRALGNLRVAAIGPGTADALLPFGIKPDVVPDNFRGEALAEAILKAYGASDMRGVRILLPRAAVARDVLPDTLRAAGAEVDVVPAYETHGASPESRAQLRGLLERRELDVITFTASSTVTHTLAALEPDGPALLRGLTLASIGPITTQTARDAGLEVQVTAEEYTIEGLVNALHQHFSESEHA
ncbi:MAG TPA: uroporphyrinogen-III C-methyltransferase [Polyangiales bacterium]|nr:uroporphyrinogen-III C-methyltransferase [Polyangiales bacterium]